MAGVSYSLVDGAKLSGVVFKHFEVETGVNWY